MKQKRVWRYYCEFCKKSGCSAGHMKLHEKHCTANPGRECRMCKMVDGEQKPLAELVAVFDGWRGYKPLESDPDTKARIVKLEDLTNGCPACMLAAARVVTAQYEGIEGDGLFSLDVDYKRRCRDLLDVVNAEGE